MNGMMIALGIGMGIRAGRFGLELVKSLSKYHRSAGWNSTLAALKRGVVVKEP